MTGCLCCTVNWTTVPKLINAKMIMNTDVGNWITVLKLINSKMIMHIDLGTGPSFCS